MGLRTTTLTPQERSEPRTREEWRRRVDETLMAASSALLGERTDEFRRIFADVAGWTDEQRAYQARRQLVELAFSTAARAAGDRWLEPYAAAAEALLDALEDEPREPVLMNYLGVLLYELLELGAAEAAFRAAERLDPALPHVRKNLRAVRERKRGKAQARLEPRFAATVRGLGARARRVAGAAKPVTGLTLSLCMIVKDEEEMLPGCLEAVRDAVDEIVVVDTGSSDGTVEIAESFGAKVVRFPWNGSFADARNVSLEHATGDWILYLDADEHLLPGEATGLRGLLGRTWREAFYLVETNYTGGDESGSAVTHLALRLFRNRPAYRFEGRIHEQKTHTMPTYLPERFETTTIRMRHYGYLASRISAKDKARRNLELLELEALESPHPFTLFNIGSEYLGLNEADKACEYLDEAWELIKRDELWDEVGWVPLVSTRLAKARRQAGDREGALRGIAEARKAYPDHTDLVFESALCAKEAGDLEEARELAERCLAMGDSPARYTATIGSGSYLALSLLAEVEARSGRSDEAERLLRRSLAEHPDYLGSILPLATLMFARGASPEDVAREIPSSKPSALLLVASACYEAGRFEAAEGWFRDVLARQPGNGAARVALIESLLSQRRYADAVEEARREPADSPTRSLAALAELFGLALQGAAGDLQAALGRAEEAGVPWQEVELYRAWHGILAGRGVPPVLPAAVIVPAATALEALLRVQEIDAFAALLPVYEATAVDERERRELLARMYFRRGFLESAADEWIAVATEVPDARALVGLAQVALARGFTEDALAFAEESVVLDPAAPEPRSLRDALVRRSAA